jgi:uncharacterized membrane protein YccC
LKPGYSLTRKRNFERLTGTIIGGAIGALLLYFVKDRTAIVIFLIISMICAYSFVRKRYFVSVIFMTLYLLLMFQLLDPKEFKMILSDRIIDTAIGSVIALIFGYVLAPIWEHEQVSTYMSQVLKDLQRYYELISAPFTGQPLDERESVFVRRNSWVSLANLSDAFTRMLSEPKSKQKNIEYIHQFVAATHMLASHTATLSYYADSLQPEYITNEYQPVINASVYALEQSRHVIEGTKNSNHIKPETAKVRLLDERINVMVKKRQEEIQSGQMETQTSKQLSDFKSITDQFYFIYKIAVDVEKISLKLI